MFEIYRAIFQDAEQNREAAKLTMPVLAVGGRDLSEQTPSGR